MNKYYFSLYVWLSFIAWLLFPSESVCNLADPLSLGVAGLLAGGSALSGLFSGIFGSHSQSKTNAQNYRMFQEQMAYDTQMYERQRDDYLADWNRQRQADLADLADERAYNDPSAQVRRLIDAGLNPALAFGSGNNTSPGVQSSTGSPSAPGRPGVAGAPQLQAYDWSPIARAVSENAQMFFQAQQSQAETDMIKAQTRQIDIENSHRDALLDAQINDFIKSGKLKSWQADKLMQDYRFREEMNPLEIQSQRLQNSNLGALFTKAQMESRMLQEQIVGQQIANKISEKSFSFMDSDHRAQLGLIASQCASNYASADASRAQASLFSQQAETEVTKRIQMRAQTQGIRITNKQAKILYRQAAFEYGTTVGDGSVLREANIPVNGWSVGATTGSLFGNFLGRVSPLKFIFK